MIITQKDLDEYRRTLIERERSGHTIQKYIHDIKLMLSFMEGRALCKELLIEYKAHLTQSYSSSSVNSMLAAANSFLGFLGREDLKLALLKIQRQTFSSGEKELSGEEYSRLIRAAEKKNERLSLIVQTICSTGIRVSELRFITAGSVYAGRAEISCKGKRRTVFLPSALQRLLKRYIGERGIKSGAVFVTRTGKPIDRSNIWRELKRLGKTALVAEKKLFPHNLRHLFARTYYSMEKDLSRLADILGHSSLSTTRIYTMESGEVHARQIERLGLVLTT